MDDHFSRMLAPTEGSSDDTSRKRKRDEAEGGDSVTFGPAIPGAPQQKQSVNIEKLLEEADHAQVDNLDVQGLKVMMLSFEKKINKNQVMRMKYSDQPAKFMESEIDLSQEIKRMAVVAAAPDLYPQLVAANAVTSILGLLTHENTDISIEAIALLAELTDPETIAETDEAMGLVDAMLEKQSLELLVQNLSRLDEQEEEDAQGVYNTLAIFENLTEVKPTIAVMLCEKTGFLKFLLKRLKVRKFDANKLYCSEILSILLTADIKNAKLLGTMQGMDGVDMLLQIISHYRRRDPSVAEEEECVGNLFSCMCTAMMVQENQTKFRHSEGFELMLRCMKERKLARALAVKVIDYAIQGNESNCAHLIDAGGLKTLFPAFMGVNYRKADVKKGEDGSRSKKQKQKHIKLDPADEQELEEHIISVVCTVVSFTALTPVSDAWLRVLAKFIEDDFAKVDRLMELYTKYARRLELCEARVAAKVRQQQLRGDEDSDDEFMDDEVTRYLQRLDEGGLYTLQRLATVVGYVGVNERSCGFRLRIKLQEQDKTMESVRAVVTECAENLGDDEGEDEAAEKLKAERVAKQKAELLLLVEKLKDDDEAMNVGEGADEGANEDEGAGEGDEAAATRGETAKDEGKEKNGEDKSE